LAGEEDGEEGAAEADEAGVEGEAGRVEAGTFAVATEDPAAGGEEVGLGGALVDGVVAGDTEGEFGHEAGGVEEAELEGEEGFFGSGGGFDAGEGATGEEDGEVGEVVKEVWVGVMLLDEHGDELGGVEGEVDGAEVVAEAEVTFEEGPLGEGGHVAFWGVDEDGVTEVEEVEAPVEAGVAGLGGAFGALGDDFEVSVGACEDGEDLARFGVIEPAEADGGVVDEGHGGG
jgi:hypothetical protein